MEGKLIGENMSSIRREAHYTQKDVAEFLGVTEPMISFYERGSIKLPLIVAYKLTWFFDCKMEDFLKGVTDNA